MFPMVPLETTPMDAVLKLRLSCIDSAEEIRDLVGSLPNLVEGRRVNRDEIPRGAFDG